MEYTILDRATRVIKTAWSQVEYTHEGEVYQIDVNHYDYKTDADLDADIQKRIQFEINNLNNK
jgi:hypothetical protein